MIIVLNNDARETARQFADQHLSRTVYHGISLMSSAHVVRKSAIARANCPWLRVDVEDNHPWAKWTRKSKQNYQWVFLLTSETFKELLNHYGNVCKGTDDMRVSALKDAPAILSAKPGLTPFPLHLPPQYKFLSKMGTIGAYRELYIDMDNTEAMSWDRGRTKPSWYE